VVPNYLLLAGLMGGSKASAGLAWHLAHDKAKQEDAASFQSQTGTLLPTTGLYIGNVPSPWNGTRLIPPTQPKEFLAAWAVATLHTSESAQSDRLEKSLAKTDGRSEISFY